MPHRSRRALLVVLPAVVVHDAAGLGDPDVGVPHPPQERPGGRALQPRHVGVVVEPEDRPLAAGALAEAADPAPRLPVPGDEDLRGDDGAALALPPQRPVEDRRALRIPARGLGAREVRLVPCRVLAHPRVARPELRHARRVLAHRRQPELAPLRQRMPEGDQRLDAVALGPGQPQVRHGERPAARLHDVVRHHQARVADPGRVEARVVEELGARLADPDDHVGRLLRVGGRRRESAGGECDRNCSAHQSFGRISRSAV